MIKILAIDKTALRKNIIFDIVETLDNWLEYEKDLTGYEFALMSEDDFHYIDNVTTSMTRKQISRHIRYQKVCIENKIRAESLGGYVLRMPL